MDKIVKGLHCELCSLQFDKKYAYDTHLKKIHGKIVKIKLEETWNDKEETKVKCNICEEPCRYSELYSHSCKCGQCDCLIKEGKNLLSGEHDCVLALKERLERVSLKAHQVQ